MENNEKELEERELKELELMNENENREFYVYLHIRLDNMTPFYVGKGKRNRCYIQSRGKHHDNICKTCGYKIVKIKENLTESQAFKLENKMIKYYVHMLGYGIDIEGYDDYDHALPHLTNKDWGGIGGKSGISPWNKGKKMSEEYKQKMKGENNPMYGKHRSEESKRKQSELMKGKMAGEKHPMYGKHHTEESKRKQSESMKGKMAGEKHPMWGKPAPNRSKVICVTTGKKFDSQKEAAIHYNIAKSSISDCCRNKRNYAGKLKDGTKLQWMYLEDYNNESKAV